MIEILENGTWSKNVTNQLALHNLKLSSESLQTLMLIEDPSQTPVSPIY